MVAGPCPITMGSNVGPPKITVNAIHALYGYVLNARFPRDSSIGARVRRVTLPAPAPASRRFTANHNNIESITQ